MNMKYEIDDAQLLLFESLGLMLLVQDLVESKSNFMIAMLVGLISGSLPYGFVIGLTIGTIIYYANMKGLTGLKNMNNF